MVLWWGNGVYRLIQLFRLLNFLYFTSLVLVREKSWADTQAEGALPRQLIEGGEPNQWRSFTGVAVTLLEQRSGVAAAMKGMREDD